jgi:hypothetical protein
MTTTDKSETMKAIQDVLKKIDRLNATAKTLRETTPGDALSLAEFDLDLKQDALAA